MKEFKLKFLNADSNNTIQYLPYGVTTIEFEAEHVDMDGYVITKRNFKGGMTKRYVGLADDSDDFFVVWGAGEENGQFVSSDSNKRMFLQLIHLGNNIKDDKITFTYTGKFGFEQQLQIAPIICDDVVKMNVNRKINNSEIKFSGSKIPSYYARWFPPRPNKNEEINYDFFQLPDLCIEYEENDSGIKSPILISIQHNNKKHTICSIQGDLHYSYPHAEIFSFIPDQKIFVLRLWLYWIHKKFRGNFFYGLSPGQDPSKYTRKLAQKISLEIPDIERFDFVIDGEMEKILWYGTDFHYQEYWGYVDTEVVDANVAGDVDLIVESISMLNHRFNTMQNYNPVDTLKRIILEEPHQLKPLEISVKEKTYSTRHMRTLNLRTHVPYVKNKIIYRNLISSIVSKNTN